jgi:hypothetical protein
VDPSKRKTFAPAKNSTSIPRNKIVIVVIVLVMIIKQNKLRGT